MGKPTGFLDYTRVDCPSRDVAARTGDYAPVELPLSERNRRRQSGGPSSVINASAYLNCAQQTFAANSRCSAWNCSLSCL